MINATIDQYLSIRVRLEFIGNNGANVSYDALFDTGFSEYFSLPRHLIDVLGYTETDREIMILGDGTQREISIYEGHIIWDGQEQNAAIHCLDDDALVGMRQIENYLVTIPVRVGETATLVYML